MIKDILERLLQATRIKPLEKKVHELLQDLDTYRALVESTTDHIFMVDRKCRYLFINRCHLASMDMPMSAVLGRSYGDFHQPEETHTFAKNIEEVFRTGLSTQQEYQRARDKKYFLRTFSPVRLPFPVGEIKAVAIVSKDITELQQIEHLYRALAEKSLFGVYILQNGQFQWINQRFVESIGYKAQELVGMSPLDIVHRDDLGRVRRNALAMLRGESSTPYEYRIITKDGAIRWCRESVTSVIYKGMRSVLGSTVDITQLKHAEDALAACKADPT
ncbi:MAG: PAS domain S-box protein [Syntrophales bacterium]|nr:PAS domain S-box protein [Syntrophales bacterium]